MEKLEINNFCGIKKVEIIVRKLNIIIGEQASGKSIIMKLLYFFKEITGDLYRAKILNTIDKNFMIENKFNTYFDETNWGRDSFVIKYSYSDKYYITIKNKKEKVEIKFSDSFEEIRDYLSKEPNDMNLFNSLYFSANQKKYNEFLEKKIGESLVENNAYIPAGRSFYSLIKSNSFSFMNGGTNPLNFEPFILEFGMFYDRIVNKNEILFESFKDKKKYRELKEKIEKILKGEIVFKKGESYLKLLNGNQLKSISLSSGQQELIPLIATLVDSMEEPRKSAYYIEEPEAHLFPSSQKVISEIIAWIFNKKHHQIFLTTHSPYIVSTFNNLLYADELSLKNKEEVSNIIPKSYHIHKNDIAVFSLKNGESTSIICEETGLIDASIIDEISSEIGNEFQDLLELGMEENIDNEIQ